MTFQVFPACSNATKAQKITKLKLSYVARVLCNDAGKGVLESRIVEALEDLNNEWKFSTCTKFTKDECEDWGININCNKRSTGAAGPQSPNNLVSTTLNYECIQVRISIEVLVEVTRILVVPTGVPRP